MTINEKPVYKRILLKLSGEALRGPEEFGINEKILNHIAQEIKELVELDVQIGVVIGGGNFFRGARLKQKGMNRVVGDYMGMLATIMNSLAMWDALHRLCVHAHLMSSIPLSGICDNYSWAKAINLLSNNRVVILSSGTGNPFFTTDSAACLRGIEIESDIVLKATKVDGVFTSDPGKDPHSSIYDRLSFSEVLEKGIKVMDLSAFALARDHKLPICIFNINKPRALYHIVMGEKEGTLIM